MPLCDTCLAIPFTSLPPFRPCKSSILKYRSRDNNNNNNNNKRHHGGGKLLPVVSWHDLFSKEQIRFRDFGVPYHENLEALASSAAATKNLCSLCELVWEAAQAWRYHLERFEKEKIREQQLWITACHGGVPGLYVWIPKPKSYNWFMLAAVGFSVDSSMGISNRFLFFYFFFCLAPFWNEGFAAIWADQNFSLKHTIFPEKSSRDPLNETLDPSTRWILQPIG